MNGRSPANSRHSLPARRSEACSASSHAMRSHFTTGSRQAAGTAGVIVSAPDSGLPCPGTGDRAFADQPFSPQQTETARFWLMLGAPAYQPLARELVVLKHMSVIDSARFMALYAMAQTDCAMAFFDAKYLATDHRDPQWRHRWQPGHRAGRNLAADRQHADAPGIPVCALRPEHHGRLSHRSAAWYRGYPRSRANQLDRAGGHPPIYQPARLRRRGCERPHLGGLPLPVLDPRRHGRGTPIWRIPVTPSMGDVSRV
jgi:hypothetical protein